MSLKQCAVLLLLSRSVGLFAFDVHWICKADWRHSLIWHRAMNHYTRLWPFGGGDECDGALSARLIEPNSIMIQLSAIRVLICRTNLTQRPFANSSPLHLEIGQICPRHCFVANLNPQNTNRAQQSTFCTSKLANAS